jgi:hypothetical protein
LIAQEALVDELLNGGTTWHPGKNVLPGVKPLNAALIEFDMSTAPAAK